MRCFIAMDLPEAIREKIGRIQEQLKEAGADARWVRPAQIHLTLLFFGEIPEAVARQLAEKFKEVLSGIGPVKLDIEGLGGFPSVTRPRVAWVGIAPSPDLNRLYQALREAAGAFGEDIGEEEKKGFVPHLTIGRIRSERNLRPLIDRLKEMSRVSVGSCRIDELVFYESRLTPEGPVYTPFDRFSLNSNEGDGR